jgi:hypothetical protein
MNMVADPGAGAATRETLTRRILALAGDGRMPYEIADALETTAATVRTVLWRARRGGAEIPHSPPRRRPPGDTTQKE